ncbi:MAG: ABC transporter permease subunit [Xanthomonadales bacterium]|nr:ABC transporter permease [Xanthomonadales bacterium]NIX12032.1 ABC transporter permease subunit [Xanthomonadales bacterium]
MTLPGYILRKTLTAIPLLAGVTFISFLLMVHFGPDKTYELLGKNPTAEQIAEVRQQLGYDRPFLVRYTDYVRELATMDLGHSDSSGESVASLIARTLPVTAALVLPGFVLGNVLGVLLGMFAAWRRGTWPDRLVMGASVVGMSISFLVIIILLQVLLCTPWGFNWFPSRGWEVSGPVSYLYYVTVPTLALVLVTLGYNTRFYRAVMVEELGRDHVRTARAFGARPAEILFRHALKNSLVPVLTRFMFSIPLVIISGSLLLETYFGIPGIGKVTFDAITSGDQPVLKAVVGLTAVLFVLAQVLIDIFYRMVDPRVAGA